MDILAKKEKCYQYKFYNSENQTTKHQATVDEHTKNYTEISKYLAMPHAENIKDVEQLYGFPAVKDLHKKFNAIMPSEADVERLFSFAGNTIFCFYFYASNRGYHGRDMKLYSCMQFSQTTRSSQFLSPKLFSYQNDYSYST